MVAGEATQGLDSRAETPEMTFFSARASLGCSDQSMASSSEADFQQESIRPETWDSGGPDGDPGGDLGLGPQ